MFLFYETSSLTILYWGSRVSSSDKLSLKFKATFDLDAALGDLG